jgi:hypothetical protein
MIDCYSCEVVVTVDNAPYVALSYVWGAASISDGSSNPHFGFIGHQSISRTIRDAMHVTKSLGLRYLWVDKYCIDQNSAVEKHDQIGQMAAIYQGAEITIIAAAGTNADSGLPGILDTHRKPQTAVINGDIMLVSSMPSSHPKILDSIWATRAWTLQEAVLSVRRLVFTEVQMYFECNVMTCHESVSIELDLLHSPSKQKLQPCVASGIFSGEPGLLPPRHKHQLLAFDRYLKLLCQYSSRRLSYDADSMNAFLGIVQQFDGTTLGQATLRQLWGLPFLVYGSDPRRSAESLTFSLLWRHDDYEWPHQRGSNRRVDFPSWSPMGWGGEVSFLHSYTTVATEDMDGVDFRVRSRISSLILEFDGLEPQVFNQLLRGTALAGTKEDECNRPTALVLTARAVHPDELWVMREDYVRLTISGYKADLFISQSLQPHLLEARLKEMQFVIVYVASWAEQRYFLVLQQTRDAYIRIGFARSLMFGSKLCLHEKQRFTLV